MRLEVLLAVRPHMPPEHPLRRGYRPVIARDPPGPFERAHAAATQVETRQLLRPQHKGWRRIGSPANTPLWPAFQLEPPPAPFKKPVAHLEHQPALRPVAARAQCL